MIEQVYSIYIHILPFKAVFFLFKRYPVFFFKALCLIGDPDLCSTCLTAVKCQADWESPAEGGDEGVVPAGGICYEEMEGH